MKIVEYDKNDNKRKPVNVVETETRAKEMPVRSNISKRRKFIPEGKLSFAYKKYTKEGIISLILCSIAVVIFIVCLCLSINSGGKAAGMLGTLGFISFNFSLFAFIISIKSFTYENSLEHEFLLSHIGVYLSLALIIAWIIIFIRGFLLG